MLGACCPSTIRPLRRSTTIFASGVLVGSWKRTHDHLALWVRVSENREPSPCAASLDSQSVPTAVMVDEAVGYDAGKHIKGRKRFTLVDTLGLLIAMQVVAVNTPERAGARHNCSSNSIRSAIASLGSLAFGWMAALVVRSFSCG